MANLITVGIAGGPELQARMRELGGKQLDRVGLSALRSGASLVVREAKRLAPILKEPDPRRKPGTVQKNIRAARARGTDSNVQFQVVVGVRRLPGSKVRAFKKSANTLASFRTHGRILKSSDNPDDPYYWRFLEFRTKRLGLTPKPFLAPAFTAARQDAADRVIDRLGKALTKAGV
jgi:HK97 gp10 family phage protein